MQVQVKNVNWDIVRLAEVRRRNENKTQLKSSNILFWKGHHNKSEAGVDFFVNKNIAAGTSKQ